MRAGAFAFNGVAVGGTPYPSLWMQTLLGMSPVRAGLTLLPLTFASMVVAVLVVAVLVGRAAARGAGRADHIGGGLLLVDSGSLCQDVLDGGADWTALVLGSPATDRAGAGVRRNRVVQIQWRLRRRNLLKRKYSVRPFPMCAHFPDVGRTIREHCSISHPLPYRVPVG
ncbi:hypothetical protein [Streptomyces herbicida]|uniref:hypothetical protein n=1 Tax=Streptomyces herbicida TaxID=3065675 RepID=UPI00292D2732|nr:hypothetical protein [Streptomyces sp. NEAU-HV9]